MFSKRSLEKPYFLIVRCYGRYPFISIGFLDDGENSLLGYSVILISIPMRLKAVTVSLVIEAGYAFMI
ncbi:hypothetical protein DSUL_20483 [Desulfovibrionales bacterium]